MADDGLKGTLVIVSPSAFFETLAVALTIADLARSAHKPLLACVFGEASVRDARHLLAAAGVPTFRTPGSAVTAFSFMASYVRHQDLLIASPPALSSRRTADVPRAHAVVANALDSGRTELNADEAAAVLTAFHIPSADAGRQTTGDLREVRVPLENDPGLGPVISVGEGGSASSLGSVRGVVLPPLNQHLVIDLFRQPAVMRLFEARLTRKAISPPLPTQVLQRVSELS